jgi:peptide-methionine (R)-S-oxide reductase
MKKTNSEWAKTLEPEQFLIMREEGTEMPGSSNLNDEKRKGFYHCVGCDQKLFGSDMKYDSGSGWPSFFKSFENVFETKTDHLLGYPRIEYHCNKCGGHHGHIFDDGPKPTGKRYCNNGKVLTFKEEK